MASQKVPQLEFLLTRDETMRSTFTMGNQDSATTARRRRPNPRPLYAVSSEKQRTTLFCVLPPGSYEARWIDTKTGRLEKTEKLKSTGKPHALASPSYREDIALRIRRL